MYFFFKKFFWFLCIREERRGFILLVRIVDKILYVVFSSEIGC